MPMTVTINMDKEAALKRFQQATWKLGRSTVASSPLVYNMQADAEETADYGLMDAMYGEWWEKGVHEVSEFVTEHDGTSVTLELPSRWAGSRAALKYALGELLHNGMLGDWYDDVKQDVATAFKKKAVLNQAEIRAIVYSVNPPSME